MNEYQERKLVRFSHKVKTTHINGKKLPQFLGELEALKDQFKIDYYGKKDALDLADKIMVVDIRHNTFYKTKQGFGPANLKEHLRRIDIDYTYIKSLGNPFHKTIKDMKECKKAYQTYLDKEAFQTNGAVINPHKAFTNLYKLLRKRVLIVLICYCEPPKPCHRNWLREKLIQKKREDIGLEGNYEIPHIIDNKNGGILQWTNHK